MSIVACGSFRDASACAIERRDLRALRGLAKAAERQAEELGASIVGRGPLVDWPALRESWAQDARRLRAAVLELERA